MKTFVVVLFCLGAAGAVFWCCARRSPAPDSRSVVRLEAPIAPDRAATPPTLARSTTTRSGEGAEPSNSLPPLPNVTWERAAAEPAFSRFVEWTHRYAAAASADE